MYYVDIPLSQCGFILASHKSHLLNSTPKTNVFIKLSLPFKKSFVFASRPHKCKYKYHLPVNRF